MVAWPVVLALEFAAVFCEAFEALVCELVAGMPVLVPAAVVPVWAVVVLGAVEEDALLLMSPVAEPVVEAVVLGVVLEVDVLGVVLEAEVLGVVVEAVPLTPAPVVEAVPLAEVLGVVVLPAVVAGPLVVVEAEVPGAEALVLPVAEAVPVCAAGPEAVVVLPGFVVAVLGEFVEVGEALVVLFAEVVEPVEVVDELVEPVMPAEEELVLG